MRLLRPDDMEVGQLITILGLKNSNQPIPVAGVAFRITAIDLPFIVAETRSPYHKSIEEIDTRRFDIMLVTQEFAAAQEGSAKRILLLP